MRTQPIAVSARWARRPAGFGFLAFAAAFLLVAPALHARTLNWQGASSGSPKLWSDPVNWKDADGGTNAVPRSGDRLYLTPTGNPSKNDIEGLELEFFKLGSGFQGQNNGSKPIIFRAGSEGLHNEGFLFLARLSTFAYKKAEFPGKRVVGLHYTFVS